MERFKLSIPIAGRLYATSLAGRFSRTLALLLANNAQVPESLVLAAAATGSPVFERAGYEAALDVTNGETISNALERTGLLRRSYVWMLAHGEEHGTVESALERLAESCEARFADAVRLVLAFTGPLCMALLGLIVFFAAYAM